MSRKVKPSINPGRKHADYPIDQAFPDFTFLVVSTSARRSTLRTKGGNRVGESFLTRFTPRKGWVGACDYVIGLKGWSRSGQLERSLLASSPSPFTTSTYHHCCHSCVNLSDRGGIRADRHGNLDRDGNLDDYSTPYSYRHAYGYRHESATSDVHLHSFAYVYEHNPSH